MAQYLDVYASRIGVYAHTEQLSSWYPGQNTKTTARGYWVINKIRQNMEESKLWEVTNMKMIPIFLRPFPASGDFKESFLGDSMTCSV